MLLKLLPLFYFLFASATEFKSPQCSYSRRCSFALRTTRAKLWKNHGGFSSSNLVCYTDFDLTRRQFANSDIEISRRKIFEANFLHILQHNLVNSSEGFQLGINNLSDMNLLEYRRFSRGIFRSTPVFSNASSKSKVLNKSVTPDSWDWRTQGVITRENCGSCWAFGTVGALEAQNAISTRRLIELSEQNILDCSGAGTCTSGSDEDAMLYIIKNGDFYKAVHNCSGGIDRENAYPYIGTQEPCHFSAKEIGARQTAYQLVQGEENVKRAVASHGPVTASIDAGHFSFQHYKTGVFYEKDCDSVWSNHLVLIVGYGTDEKYGDFWIVKSSWGTTWGEDGYIRMSRNRNNNCGIANYCLLPIANASLSFHEK